jgi:membrane-associated phospholipid phosphatase
LDYAHGSLALTISWSAQFVYFSHLFVAPLVIALIWLLGVSSECYQSTFKEYVRAFTFLNFSAIVVYLLVPVAPPWWVTLNGMAQPTAVLVSQANVASAMHGSLIQAMIRNASQWFAAVPSLHGAYPVLLLLLSRRKKSHLASAGLAFYGAAMWISTVVLNQHYVIDLVAGGLLAIIAWRVGRVITKRVDEAQIVSARQLQIEETASA